MTVQLDWPPAAYDAVFSLAEQSGLTVYDAAYLHLAIEERLPLASLDRQSVQAAQDAGILLFQP